MTPIEFELFKDAIAAVIYNHTETESGSDGGETCNHGATVYETIPDINGCVSKIAALAAKHYGDNDNV